jgi:hypothetical protein
MTTLDIRGTVVGETAVAIKAPCLVATTGANIALSGVQTIDGVTVGNNSERVLVKDQTTQTQNGIYIAGTGSWVMAADWTGNNNVVCGTMVVVAGGAINAGILFVQTCTDNPIVIGTSNIAFVNEAALAGSAQTAASTSSVTIGTGSKNLTIQANRNFAVGQWVLIQETSNPANQMLGQITSYSGTALAVSVVATGGSGTHADWTIVLTNSAAAAGYQPPTGAGNVTGPGSSTMGHIASFADGTGKILQDAGPLGGCALISNVTAAYMAVSSLGCGGNMINGQIAASVTAGALTFTLLTLAGNTPQPSDPVWLCFRNTSPASGWPTVAAVEAALSITVPVGSTLGFANGTPGRLWLVAAYNAGAVSLAVINCLNAAGGTVFPLAGWGIAGVTAFGGGADNAQTFYGPGTLSNVPYSVLGHASYETGSTLATAGTWSAVPTRLELCRPGVLLPGAVVQSLYSLNTAAGSGTNNYTPSSAVPTIAGGNLVTSQAVTPSSSANLLRVRGEAMLGSTTASVEFTAFLTQDSGANALCSTGATSALATGGPSKLTLLYQALAATLISTTFKLYGTASGSAVTDVNTANGAGAFYGGTSNSYLLVEEIMA